MTDFVQEVEEGLRADRYREGLRRGWPIAAGVLLLIVLAVGGFWGWKEYRERAAISASQAYQRALDAGERRNATAAASGFAEAADAGAPGYRALALMHQAGQRAQRNDAAGALRLFDEAADAAPTPLLADAAALQGAFAAMDQGAAVADIERRLTPLAAEGRPYRPLAREALAYVRLANGRAAEARRELVILSLSESSPETLRTRARAAMQLIDTGGAPAVNGVAQAARAMPTPPPIPATPLPPAQPAPAAPPAAAAPAPGPAQ